MILPVNDHFRLAADARCWALEELRTRKREGRLVNEWTAIRWFASLDGAVNGYAEFALRTSTAQNVAEALAQVRRIAAELCSALQPFPDLIATLVANNPGIEPAKVCKPEQACETGDVQ